MRSLKVIRNLNGDIGIKIQEKNLVESLRVLLDLNEAPLRDPESFLRRCVDQLAEVLTPEEPTVGYLEDFLSNASDAVEAIATLNYDLLIENAASNVGINYDYGMGDWNRSRTIKFAPSATKLLKIHGSLNWYFRGHDQVDVMDSNQPYYRRAMIFGGQSEKLNPDGPFMSLRGEFQRLVNSTNVLAIAGYSFGDHHLNSIIRSWLSIKRKGKLILVNPAGSDILGPVLRVDTKGNLDERVELVTLSSGLKAAVPSLVEELQSAPKLKKKSS